jgi:LmbE family N-acetylglucosaminyl deacetylase
MLPFTVTPPPGRPLRVLCLGAHCDDIEIGCGGTLIATLDAHPTAAVTWVVFSSNGDREPEARRSAEAHLSAVTEKHVVVDAFTDGFFPYEGERLKKRFESIRQAVDPDVVFTHHAGDAHQDHRLVHELTWNTFRDHTILQYEIPKYEGDLGRPNLYVPLDRDSCTRKVERLMRHYRTQQNKHWFTEETFFSIMRIRGVECRSPSGYAEAFHCPKLTLRPRPNFDAYPSPRAGADPVAETS